METLALGDSAQRPRRGNKITNAVLTWPPKNLRTLRFKLGVCGLEAALEPIKQ